ncbi:MAG: class I SAM-dependent methyltransferase [Actinomycetota bacterium]|nr:class I SAM-dependent methyltransferase [Actinomycetota bacterium]
MDRKKIIFTGTQETALITLYGKAMESRSPDSILRDGEADSAMQRIDYDFSKTKLSRRDQISTAVRAKAFDQWVEHYLDAHPDCTVLHLGCGLDTRVQRVDPPPSVRWYDIDLPDVIDLRRRLYPEREGYHTIAPSVTDPHLLDGIPGDKPVLVVAEGLTPYLRAADGVAMVRRVTEHFPSGELLFDGYSRLGAWMLQRFGPVKATGARVKWSIGDPHELMKAVPGLVFDSEWWFGKGPEIQQHYPWAARQLLRIIFHTPLRRLGRGLRYHFGQDNT